MSNRAARTEVFELGLDPKQAHSPQQLEEARKLVCVEETPLDATHDVLETCVVHDNESLLAIHDPIDHTAIRKIVDKEEEKLKQKEEEVSKTVSLETKTDLLEEVSSSATKEEEKPVVVEETPKPRKRSKKSEE